MRTAAPVGTTAAIATTVPVWAIGARGLDPGLLLGLRLLLAATAVAVAAPAAIRARTTIWTRAAVFTLAPVWPVLPLADHRAGRAGLGHGPAQQRQDHRGRDQTFHFRLQKALC
jgi:hypothetical protein